MKVIRAAAVSVIDAPKGTMVDFWLNEAIPESPEDEESLARIRVTAADAYEGLVASDDPPFQDRLVCVWHRRDGIDSIAMFSFQAAVILFTGASAGILARTEKGGYGCTLGEIDGRPFMGLISKDRERVLLVTSKWQAVIDAMTSVLFVCKSSRNNIPHPALDCGQAIADRIPKNAELLVVRARTAEQAFAALGKYAIPYLEEIP